MALEHGGDACVAEDPRIEPAADLGGEPDGGAVPDPPGRRLAVAGPGDSGGPALVDDKRVGVVFRRAQDAGIVIPNEEIDAFLDEVKDGRYDG